MFSFTSYTFNKAILLDERKELLFEWSIFQGCTMYRINLLNTQTYILHSWNIETKIFIKESYLWQILNVVAAAESVSDQTDDGGDDSPSQISSLVFLVRIVEVNPHTRLLSRLLLFYKYENLVKTSNEYFSSL